jgi:hypothetical protein
MTDVTGIKYKNDDDKWYRYKGVKPPERQSHGLSEDDIESWVAKNNAHAHVWKQKGNYIFCTAGQNEHGQNVGVFQRLHAEMPTNKDGTPNLVKI